MMVFQELINGKLDGIEDDLEPMYEEMSKHIALQRKRLGGNMAIAQAVFSRGQRERIRKMIGPDLVFIVMNLTKECQLKRIESRHGDQSEWASEFMPFLDDELLSLSCCVCVVPNVVVLVYFQLFHSYTSINVLFCLFYFVCLFV